ncbi:MAG: oxidoreductase [Proteobacteria bacterium]|nr:oxidoreductase [Pseudomonadota bacterium]NOG60161.1 oxidoreductase [Pseudomonadota bacterium]
MENNDELLEGLKAIASTAFPKKCSYCGKEFKTAEQFLLETKGTASSSSGLMESIDDDDNPIVEAYRNCTCGSTLMDIFGNRRNTSEQGLKRREQFGKMLDYLIEQGLDKETARNELLKFVRGEETQRLNDFKLQDIYKL